MDQYDVPSIVEFDPEWNTTQLLAERLAAAPQAPMIEVADGLRLRQITAEEFTQQVRSVAKGLIAAGIRPGDRIALMSRTRAEWALMDFAIWSAGAVTVPVYETSSPEQVRWICSDSGAVAAVVELDRHRQALDEAIVDLPDIRHVWQIEGRGLAELSEAGEDVADSAVEERSRIARAEDLATIIYTSGTTGRPKGVELTHGNFVWMARTMSHDMGQIWSAPDSRVVFFLPLAHVIARVVQAVVISSATVMTYSPDLTRLVPTLQEFRPTFLLAVPRVLEKVYNGAEQTAGSGLRGRIFSWASRVAVEYSRRLDHPAGVGAGLTLRHRIADKLVFHKIRAALGGQVKYVISGGAPLGERLGHFYRGIGLVVCEGYGLTETSAPTTVNRPYAPRIGTVGPPLSGTGVRISPEGEILVRGPHIFARYRHDEQATAAAFDGEWFRTGDIGALDEDGYLRITGRMKEILVTAGGKNVAPAPLEDRLRAHPLISQCVVVGDRRPYIGALVTLDAEMLPGWLASRGSAPLMVEQALDSPLVLQAVQEAVDEANKSVSRAESIRRFSILPIDLTEANGYLTPSLKLRRSRVVRDFGPAIEELYARVEPGDRAVVS